MRRILVYTLQFPPSVGGVQMMAYQLSKHLAMEGIEIIVLTQEYAGATEFDAQQKFQILRFPLGLATTVGERLLQKWRLMLDLASVVRDTNPCCVLCMQWDPCGYIARTVCALNVHPRPYYLLVHGMELMQLPSFPLARRLKAAFRLFALKGARRIFAVSHFTRGKVLTLGIPPERVSVIPNGVECEEEISVRRTVGDRQSYKNLLTVSRLVPRKAHDAVLQTLPKVIQRIPNLIYHIAGAGPERERLEQLVRRLGLEKHVKFYGEVEEKEKDRLLAECDLFVLLCRASATDFEGFGIAFLEAMRYGKPVIGGNSGGVPEVVRDGETGILVNPDDEEALANAILKILQNSDEAQRLGEKGFREVRAQFKWDAIAKKYLTEMDG